MTCNVSIPVEKERNDGDITLQLGKCPKCGKIKIEKWRKIKSYISTIRSDDLNKQLKIAEGA
jgi:uncharacterized C2H2 Zn-finger protein